MRRLCDGDRCARHARPWSVKTYACRSLATTPSEGGDARARARARVPAPPCRRRGHAAHGAATVSHLDTSLDHALRIGDVLREIDAERERNPPQIDDVEGEASDQ